MNRIQVDFGKQTGEVKPLNGVCCAPYASNKGSEQPTIKAMFPEAHIPYCRLHDCCGAYGGSRFVDVPNIFRDFDADENDPASYDFYYTDEYIAAIQASGCEAYYRLGVTIEWGSRKYAAVPPPDFEKWARVCEHIVRHYNEGWANGFHYGLKYWEIWNEPENPGNEYGPSMWTGTEQEFFDLYRIASKHLKKAFPDLLIGGYGGCGFYAVTAKKFSKTKQGFVDYYLRFLDMVKQNDCPLDFYSWHIYSDDPGTVIAHAKYVRETLDARGFTATESHLNEWNFNAEGTGFADKHTMVGGSFLASTLCLLQESGLVDKAMYYCFSTLGLYNGFLDQNDRRVSPSWYPFAAFGKLYGLGKAAAIAQNEGELETAAATNGEKCALLLSHYRGDESKTAVELRALPAGARKITARYCTEEKHLDPVFSFTVNGETTVELDIPCRTVVLLEIE